nr:MAG TPA: hypothetical protein [Caudoviricetes sp.]
MSKIETGGPAFPVHPEIRESEPHAGMTLRDHFACLAMQGLAHVSAARDWPFNPKQLAQEAYEWADAMIVARGGDRD